MDKWLFAVAGLLCDGIFMSTDPPVSIWEVALVVVILSVDTDIPSAWITQAHIARKHLYVQLLQYLQYRCTMGWGQVQIVNDI